MSVYLANKVQPLQYLNFTEKIVVPNQKDYAWYHQRFRRVPTIDECYTDDPVCQQEAQLQFKKDKYLFS
jgi:NADH dehydrogenase (ubiquinone) 1 beta subcomplex subunit 10